MKLFLLLFLLFLPSISEAATRYVDSGASGCATPSDNDYDPATRACGSGAALVYNTVNAAKNAASGGDDIFVRGNGTIYAECIDDPPNGTASKDTYLGGYQSERPILRPSVSGCGGRVIRLRADANVRRYIQIDNLELDGSTANVVGIDIAESSAGPSGVNPNNIKITRNIIRSDAHSCIYSNGKDHYIAENFFDTCGATDLGHGIYSHGENEIVERNEFVGMVGYAWQYYCSTGCTVPGRGTFRYNVIRNGQRGALASIAPADIYGNICFNNSHSHGCARATRTGTRIYNNIAINQSVGVSLPTSGHVVRNNILLATTPISDSGTNTISHNLTTGVASDYFVDPPTSGTDATYSLALKSTASTAIDQGTATIATGLTLTCVGNCDIGVFEVPKFNSCSATGNTISLLVDNTRFPPISNLATTGITATIDGSGRTLSAPTLVGSNQVNFTFSGAAVASTATSAGATVGISDSGNIGGIAANDQKVLDWTTTGCNVTGAGSAVLTQTYFRGHDLLGPEDAPILLRATSQNFSVQQGGCFRCRLKVACTGAACLPFAPVIRYKKNSGSFTAVPAAFDGDNFRYYGTSDTSADIPGNLSAVTAELLTSDHGSNVSSAFLRAPDNVPNLTLTQNSEVEIEGAFCVDRDEAVGTTYELRVYRGDGTAINAYNQTPVISVVAAAQHTLAPWDMQIRYGSEIKLGSVVRRPDDGSREINATVPFGTNVFWRR